MSNQLNVYKEQLQRKSLIQNMNFDDFLYYEFKELSQEYDYWNEKAYKQFRGAKVRARGLLRKMRDIQSIQLEISEK